MPSPWPNDLPDDFRAQLLRGITGFEIPIDRIEGKFKLGQNRSEADQEKMLGHLLAGGKDARELAAFIEREWSRPTS
jgi:transcriptional regulator